METKKSEDRRTRYTKSVIHEAFYAIIVEKGFAKMSVTDLCQRAEINRGTFYLHYTDKFALLDEIIDQALDEEPPYEERFHTLCQRVPVKDEHRLLYSNPDTFARIGQRIIERASATMVPEIMGKTGMGEDIARMILVFAASGNMAVNGEMGWKRSESFNKMQELLREYHEGGCARLRALAEAGR